MKVILNDKIDKLGEPGDIKEVANGYARNFLLPRGLAIPATAAALKEIENRKANVSRRQQNEQSQAEAQAARLQGLTILLYARTGEQNRLYGSITSNDVAEALRVQHQITVDRRRVRIDNAIHRTGSYTATVNVGRNLNAQVNLLVEAESNRTTGALTTVAAQAPVVAQPEAVAAVEAPAVDIEGNTVDTAPETASAATSFAVADTAPETANDEISAPVEDATVVIAPVAVQAAPDEAVATSETQEETGA